MELFVFGRFPVKPGKEMEYEEALAEVVEASRKQGVWRFMDTDR